MRAISLRSIRPLGAAISLRSIRRALGVLLLRNTHAWRAMFSFHCEHTRAYGQLSSIPNS